MQAISQQVMSSDTYTSPTNQSKKFNLKNLLNSLNIRFIFTGLVAIVVVVGSYLLFQTKKDSVAVAAANKINVSQAATTEPIQNTTAASNTTASVIAVKQNKLPPELNNNNLPAAFVPLTKPDSVPAPKQTYTVPVQTPHKKTEDTLYAFPKLSEKEIKANNKQKKKMIEQLMKIKKEKYAFIPTGTFNYKSQPVSVQSFYMQASEVSNLEYRTFLFDLLIEGRKEEFIKAKPNQQQWVKEVNKANMQVMADNYFSQAFYNDYPVVNISREGAKMYCNWLSIEANKFFKEKGKALLNDLRIPSDVEWAYAAQAGTSYTAYPWGERIQNQRGCFMANFCVKKMENLPANVLSECNNKAFPNAYTSAGLMLGEGTYTSHTYTYNPNDYYLYCMCGNVAEMVNVLDLKTFKPKAVGTKGGGWNSDAEHIKINGEDEYAGKTEASPFIGFRPVITYTGK